MAPKGFPLPFFIDFRAHFLYVESNCKESKIHLDLVHTEVPEAFVVHVVFHLSEDGLWLYASFPPIFYSFFRSKSFRGLLSVFGKTVVDFDDPVALDGV